MTTERLMCNSCGAPLEVPSAANFITCNHCSTQLKVRRDENVTFTESLDRLADRTEQLTEKVENLTSLNEIAALDRKWELERENYMISGKDGRRSIPTKGTAVGGGVMITVFGAFWTAMAAGITSSGPSFGGFGIAKVAFPLFGVVFVVAGIATSINSYNKAERYQSAERHYRRRRDELENRR